MGSLIIDFDQHTRNAYGFPVTVEVFGPEAQFNTEKTFLNTTLKVAVNDPGVYHVRAELPSGELLNTSVILDKSGDQVAVLLESEDQSSYERLSWAYAGHGIGMPRDASVSSATGDHAYVNETSQGETFRRPHPGEQLENVEVNISGVFTAPGDLIYRAIQFHSSESAYENSDEFDQRVWPWIISVTKRFSLSELQLRPDTDFNRNNSDDRLISSFFIEEATPKPSFNRNNTPSIEQELSNIEPMSSCALFSSRIGQRNFRQYCYTVLPRTHDVAILFVQTDKDIFASSDRVEIDLPFARPLIRAGSPEAQALLSFLVQGSVRSARAAAERLVSDANELLQRKVEDQLSATVAGYFLLQAGRIDHPDWLQNLANWFPGLPDGAVIYGTYCLRQDRLDEARVYLIQAVRRGLPIYTIGLRFLFDGLRRLVSREGRDEELDEALELVRHVAAYADWDSHTSSLYFNSSYPR